MVRFAILGAFGTAALIFVGPLLTGTADPAADKAIQTQLAIQQAMEHAKQFRAKGDHAKAVETLEEHITRINGNSAYLELLRDVYRTHIRALLAQQQLPLAEKYHSRLTLIDSSAANDATLRPAAEKKSPAPTILPAAKQYYPADKQDAKANTPGGPVARGKSEDVFALSNRLVLDTTDRLKQAKAAVAQAEAAYMTARFVEARHGYEQAHQIDPASVAACQERWAYCKMMFVIDQLNQKNIDAKVLGHLRSEAQAAMTTFPALKDHALPALAKIDNLAKNPQATDNPERAYAIQHRGANAQGWQIAETNNFVIFHKQPREMVEKVAHVAEKTRYETFHKWFGGVTAWPAKCEIHLHPTALEYGRATGVSPGSPGHARIDSDGKTGRVVSRRLELHVDHADMLDAVLPHETTHVVMAGQFGSAPVPRWADEGVAILSEPADKIEQRRRTLVRGQRDNTLFKVKDLMTLQDFPQSRQMTAFYAQSFLLVEMLVKEKGPQAFTAFLRDGLKDGYDIALRKHYARDFNALQDTVARHMTDEVNRLSALMAGR